MERAEADWVMISACMRALVSKPLPSTWQVGREGGEGRYVNVSMVSRADYTAVTAEQYG